MYTALYRENRNNDEVREENIKKKFFAVAFPEVIKNLDRILTDNGGEWLVGSQVKRKRTKLSSLDWFINQAQYHSLWQ